MSTKNHSARRLARKSKPSARANHQRRPRRMFLESLESRQLLTAALLLGGEVSADQDAAFDGWRKALQMPSAHGLVVGRTLLFPPDDDVAGAVDAAVSLVRG